MSEEMPRNRAPFGGERKLTSAHSPKMWKGEVALGMVMGKGGYLRQPGVEECGHLDALPPTHQ
jgi:hypothetical protein